MNMNEQIVNVTLTKVCSIKADGDSDESKTITLRVTFNGVKLQDVFDKAMSSTVIAYQTGARKHFDVLVDKSTVTSPFKAPGRTTIDPIAYVLAESARLGMEPGAYLDMKKAELEKLT